MKQPPLFEHPQDVLHQWLDWDRQGGAAIAIVTETEGGAVRAPGALMAISRNGTRAGYVSGGCIDEDVALNALSAMKTGQAVSLRYGVGSPFKDLPLPCGGAIEITILPDAAKLDLQRCHDDLADRRPATLSLETPTGQKTYSYAPKMKVRIAGRGADAIALWRFCQSAGFPSDLAFPGSEAELVEINQPENDWRTLSTPTSLPEVTDDAWTAFILMFHDLHWEVPLLQQALSGPAFYIGAVGSPRAHASRCDALRNVGVSPDAIDRIRGPVGLIPSLRDASMLAVSTLAEIVGAYELNKEALFGSTALLLLAAGASSRFEGTDKLLAHLDGNPVIHHSASALTKERVGRRLGIVGPHHTARRRVLNESGWQTIENSTPELGLGSSIATGIEQIEDTPGIDAAFVLLADMPLISDEHLVAMREAMTPGVDAVMTSSDGILCPPALFSRKVFSRLKGLRGDDGARQIFESLSETRVVDIEAELAKDLDTKEDLAKLNV
ncbi:MAG: NTP transferase domain-containing protein [Pseudomonadota bacterium]